MAGGKSYDHRDRVLDKDFGQTDYPPPTIYYVALFSISPTAAGGGTELSYTGYARVAVANDPSEWDNSVSGRRSNVSEVAFPANGSLLSPTAVAFGLMDAGSGGQMWRYGPVSPTDEIPPNKIPTYAAGALVITES